MPIESPRLPRLSSNEMRAIDYEVMKHGFASQNELGRLCDEGVYQMDVGARLSAAGVETRLEVPFVSGTVTSRRSTGLT